MDHRYEYKNALNLFTEEEITEPHREAVEAVLRSFYEQMVAGIAAGRGLDPAAVRRVIDNGPYFGDEAVRAGLVDRLAYRDEVYDSLRARIGGDPEFLYLRRYLRRAGRPAHPRARRRADLRDGDRAAGQERVRPDDRRQRHGLRDGHPRLPRRGRGRRRPGDRLPDRQPRRLARRLGRDLAGDGPRAGGRASR
jgi:ClpP class serine protease